MELGESFHRLKANLEENIKKITDLKNPDLIEISLKALSWALQEAGSMQDKSIVLKKQDPRIQDLYEKALNLEKKFPEDSERFALTQGCFTFTQYLQKKLETALWNNVEFQIERNYEPLSLVLVEEVQDSLRDKEVSELESLFRNLSLQVDQRLLEIEATHLENSLSPEENQKNHEEFIKLKTSWNELKQRIDAFPVAKLFSEKEEDRKKQYYKLGIGFAEAFQELAKRNEESLALGHIALFIEECRTGWEEQIQQLQDFAGGPSHHLSLKALEIARDSRRDLMQKALYEAFGKEFSDVHFQRAARRAANDPFYLGFSEKDLGELEPLSVALVKYHLVPKMDLLSNEKRNKGLFSHLLSEYRTLKEEKKKEIFEETLDEYEKMALEDESFLLDPLEKIKDLFAQVVVWCQSSPNSIENLKQLKAELQHTGIQFNLTSFKEYEDLYSSWLKNKSPQIEESLAEKINEISLIFQKFPQFRARFNKSLLAKHLVENEEFGAICWGVQSKVLKADSGSSTLPQKILAWIGSLPFSSREWDAFSKSIDSLEESSWKNSLQRAVKEKNAESLLGALREKPQTYQTLQEIFTFGDEADLDSWLDHHAALDEDLLRGIEITALRGHLPLFRRLVSTVSLSDKLRGELVVRAAQCGNLEMFKELLGDQYAVSTFDLQRAIQAAIKKGHLEILKAAVKVDDSLKSFAINLSIPEGQLEIVAGLAWDDEGLLKRAMGLLRVSGSLKGSKTLEDQVQEIRKREVKQSAERGDLPGLKKVLKIDSSLEPLAVEFAVTYGQLEIVTDLIANNESLREAAIEFALEFDNLDMIKFLAINGEPRRSTMRLAVEMGRLEILKVFEEDVKTWRGELAEMALNIGYLGIFKYLLEGDEAFQKEVIETLIAKHQLSMLKDLFNDIELQRVALMVVRDNLGSFKEIIKRNESFRATLFNAAAQNKDLNLAQIFLENNL